MRVVTKKVWVLCIPSVLLPLAFLLMLAAHHCLLSHQHLLIKHWLALWVQPDRVCALPLTQTAVIFIGLLRLKTHLFRVERILKADGLFERKHIILHVTHTLLHVKHFGRVFITFCYALSNFAFSKWKVLKWLNTALFDYDRHMLLLVSIFFFS